MDIVLYFQFLPYFYSCAYIMECLEGTFWFARPWSPLQPARAHLLPTFVVVTPNWGKLMLGSEGPGLKKNKLVHLYHDKSDLTIIWVTEFYWLDVYGALCYLESPCLSESVFLVHAFASVVMKLCISSIASFALTMRASQLVTTRFTVHRSGCKVSTHTGVQCNVFTSLIMMVHRTFKPQADWNLNHFLIRGIGW